MAAPPVAFRAKSAGNQVNYYFFLQKSLKLSKYFSQLDHFHLIFITEIHMAYNPFMSENLLIHLPRKAQMTVMQQNLRVSLLPTARGKKAIKRIVF